MVPMGLWMSSTQEPVGLVLVLGVILGEITDRCEFYSELDVPTPRRQMAIDLKSAVAGS